MKRALLSVFVPTLIFGATVFSPPFVCFDSSECSLHGVDLHNSITHLNIERPSPRYPSSWSKNHVKLTTLSIEGKSLGSVTLSSICNTYPAIKEIVLNVKFLKLNRAALNGCNLDTLIIISINENMRIDEDTFADLTDLKHLILKTSSFKSSLAMTFDIEPMHNLRSLEINGFNMRDFDVQILYNMIGLRELDLCFNQLLDFKMEKLVFDRPIALYLTGNLFRCKRIEEMDAFLKLNKYLKIGSSLNQFDGYYNNRANTSSLVTCLSQQEWEAERIKIDNRVVISCGVPN